MKRRGKAVQEHRTVLVCVLKNKSDRRILLRNHWYRIPVAFLPKRKFTHLAFYQPASFGRSGKRIEYYARISRSKIVKRIVLLPKDKKHPWANNDYLKIELARVRKLVCPIKNIVPRRVSFGFTNLKTLLSSKNILELYGVTPTEQIVSRGLHRLGIKTAKEFGVSKGGKRYCLDFAVFCRRGYIAIECDNLKAHSGKTRKSKDKQKDIFLKRHGWRVIRVKEQDVIERLDYCLWRVEKAVKNLGGQVGGQAD